MNAQHVGLFGALGSYLHKFGNFTGRSSRSEYWWMIIWDVFFVLALGFVENLTHTNIEHDQLFATLTSGSILAILFEVIYIAYEFGNFSLTVRRFRDAGVNAYLSILTLLPLSHFLWYSELNFGYYANAAVSVVVVAVSFYMLYVALKPSKE
ncbi:DUF805 domain-containing protein [Lacticaseibacillus hulanensis]|uniref:DUF805 domain-containing protein n=1 Tax=Lacticaseibacillus hulanensis TaxID=2493111 RepID=UPI0013E3A816|nr:DUF805 domain-containing protein [Lacticaseibacillus hulanensis]